MRDFWQKSYEVDVNKPALGVIDPKTVSQQIPEEFLVSIIELI